MVHVCLMNKALSLEGSAESAARKLALDQLFSSAGRTSETAWLTWGVLVWDPFFTCVFAEVAQSKVHKIKLIAYVAGANRHRCWFVSMVGFSGIRASDCSCMIRGSDLIQIRGSDLGLKLTM